MLTASPKQLFSTDFEIFEDGERVTVLDLAWVRENGTFTIGDRRFELGRTGLMSGEFFLSDESGVVVTATKPSFFRRAFQVRIGEEVLTVRPLSLFARGFEICSSGGVLGKIQRKSLWTRSATVDLPEGMPLELRLFLTWLALLIWRRQQRSN